MRVAPLCLCLLFMLPAHIHASATPACAQGLRLNEICAGPARDWDGNGAFSSRDDEWIELVNTGATPLDLTGYFVTDGDTIPRFALDGSLAAGGVLLITGGQAHAWEQANGFPAFGLSLATRCCSGRWRASRRRWSTATRSGATKRPPIAPPAARPTAPAPG